MDRCVRVGLARAAIGLLACPGPPTGGQTPVDSGSSADTDAGGTPPDAGPPAGDGGSSSGACSPTVTPNGCAAPNSKCGLVVSKYGCQPPGTATDGQACTSNSAGDSCAAGLFCLSGACRRFCDTAAATSGCASDEACSLQLTWNGGPPAGERFFICVKTGSECDVLSQTCVGTNACYFTQAGSKCLTPGTVADGQTCQYANDCTKGAACLSLNSAGARCHRLCAAASDAGTADAGVPLSCSVGQCLTVGNFPYGVCG